MEGKVADGKVEVILSEREVRKLEHMTRQRARYQEKRPEQLHQIEAEFLYDLADKLERARLRV